MVEDRRDAALKNIRVVAGRHKVCEVYDVHQRDYQGSFRGDHAAADAVDAVGLANAAFIVRACNCHDQLLAACEAALDPDPCRYDHHGFCQAHTLAKPCEQELIRAAIAAATPATTQEGE